MMVIIGDGHSMANKITFPVHELAAGGGKGGGGKGGGKGGQFILHSLSNKQSVRCYHCQVL